MCFSARASFLAAITLAVIGYYCFTRTKSKNQLPLALIPWIFAFHQSIEGIIWLQNQFPWLHQYNGILSFTYMFIAQALWPFWVPWSISRIEPNTYIRHILKLLYVIGLVWALVATIGLLLNPPFATLSCNHVSYTINNGSAYWLHGLIMYVCLVTIPGFISSITELRFASAFIVLSLCLTYSYSPECFGSLWCFFAALMSMNIYLMLPLIRKYKVH